MVQLEWKVTVWTNGAWYGVTVTTDRATAMATLDAMRRYYPFGRVRASVKV